MQNLWQKKLKLKYSKDVFDIVQFGSSLFENSKLNDVDIGVIFNKIPIKEQLIQAQSIKEQLEEFSEIPIHISSFDLYSFFDDGNFAKEGILFYGKSLISGEYFSKRFGLISRVQIYYSLEKLKKKDKVRFNYMLNGKAGNYGLLRKYNGKLLKPGLISVEPICEKVFADSVGKLIKSFEIKKIFISE